MLTATPTLGPPAAIVRHVRHAHAAVGTATRRTSRVDAAFKRAIAAATALLMPPDHLITCPCCGNDLVVVRVTGMDGRRYHGHWRLQADGFAWGADRNDDGSTTNELVACADEACGLRRPLSEFMC